MQFRHLIIAAIVALFPLAGKSQFKEVIVEEIENEGKVPGKTYRIYAGMTNVNDQVFVVFGDSVHRLEITSTRPFYQNPSGGALAKDCLRKLIAENPALKYDSWVTIGADDNYDNKTSTLNISFDQFEKQGGALSVPKDGAWFCVPTDKQAYCKDDKRVLLMQLTTAGEINGQFSIMGKNKDGVPYTNHDVKFHCGAKEKKSK